MKSIVSQNTRSRFDALSLFGRSEEPASLISQEAFSASILAKEVRGDTAQVPEGMEWLVSTLGNRLESVSVHNGGGQARGRSLNQDQAVFLEEDPGLESIADKWDPVCQPQGSVHFTNRDANISVAAATSRLDVLLSDMLAHLV